MKTSSDFKQQRGTNPIYNVLPDIVGRLSVDETLATAEYKEIMGEPCGVAGREL